MNVLELLTTIGSVFLVAALPAAVGAPLQFSRVAWWRSAWGRHLMWHMGALALVLVLAALRLVIGDSIAFAAARAASYLAIAVAAWWRLALIYTDLRGTPPEQDHPTEGPQ